MIFNELPRNGRGVEFRFLDAVIRQLASGGVEQLRAEFVPTLKIHQALNFYRIRFLANWSKHPGHYKLQSELKDYRPTSKINKSITISS